MVFCDHCLTYVDEELTDDGHLCCGDCGKVLEDHHFPRTKTVFCDHCSKNVSGIRLGGCHLCCGDCGKLLEDSFLVVESPPGRARKGAKKVNDYIPSEGRFFHQNIKLWEYDNQEYLEKLAAKEKIANKAFETFLRNCSNDSLAARDRLAQSALESLAKSRKKQAQTPENLKKVASKNDNISESKSKEIGSFDEFKPISYQENGGRKKRQRRFAPRICK